MHSLNIEDRKHIVVTAVVDVDSFDEETINLSIQGGRILFKGEGMHIQKLDLEEGKVIITGSVDSVVYSEKRDKSEGGFLKKILK